MAIKIDTLGNGDLCSVLDKDISRTYSKLILLRYGTVSK